MAALFGTDGVRGVAGEFLTAELALRSGARGRARSRPSEHPQVLIVRDTRESGEMLEAALAAGVAAGRRARAARRRAAHAGRVAAGAPLRLRPGGRGLGLAQPVPGQRDQVLRPRGHEARRRRRRPRSSAVLGGAAPAADIGRVRELHGAAGDYLRELELRFERPATSRACASCSTARTAPPTASRPEIFRRLGADVDAIAVEPDGRNINDELRLHARRARSPSGRRAATTWASPSTATATACWPWTATATVVDGDELMALAALHLRGAGPARPATAWR